MAKTHIESPSKEAQEIFQMIKDSERRLKEIDRIVKEAAEERKNVVLSPTNYVRKRM